MTGLGQERDLGDRPASPESARSLSKPVHREDLRACLRVALGLQAAVVPAAGDEPTPTVRGTASPTRAGCCWPKTT